MKIETVRVKLLVNSRFKSCIHWHYFACFVFSAVDEQNEQTRQKLGFGREGDFSNVDEDMEKELVSNRDNEMESVADPKQDRSNSSRSE